MITLEFKLYGKSTQFASINEAIKITQFIRNKALRKWLDSKNITTNKHQETATSLYTLSKSLAKEFNFVKPLNSTARQAATERAWTAIKRFYDKTSKFPKFQNDCRSVEFKQSGWKLSDNYKYITISSCDIGTLKIMKPQNLQQYNDNKIHRVRLLKKADGYYVQFCIDATRKLIHKFTGNALGIDLGLESFYTDSNGIKIENPRFLRKEEKKLSKLQRRHSKCKKGSNNKKKAQTILAKKHLKISRQRKDFAVKTARQVIIKNDFVAIEDLQVSNMIKNHCLAKSINDASWSMFRSWLEYYGEISNVKVIAVPPQYTSQICSQCGKIIKKSLSTRTHICSCGLVMDRDENAGKNILGKAYEILNTAGQAGINASGDYNQYNNEKLLLQIKSVKEETPLL